MFQTLRIKQNKRERERYKFISDDYIKDCTDQEEQHKLFGHNQGTLTDQ